jgi:hypothetical protein
MLLQRRSDGTTGRRGFEVRCSCAAEVADCAGAAVHQVLGAEVKGTKRMNCRRCARTWRCCVELQQDRQPQTPAAATSAFLRNRWYPRI